MTLVQFRRIVKERRLDKELTHRQLADIVGCTGMTISNIETGRCEPKYNLISSVSKALGIERVIP